MGAISTDRFFLSRRLPFLPLLNIYNHKIYNHKRSPYPGMIRAGRHLKALDAQAWAFSLGLARVTS